MERADGTHKAAGRDRRAILLVCAGMLLLVMNDAAAKWLVARYSPLQIVLVRSALALPLIVALILWRKGRRGLLSARPGVHAVRGVFAVAATFCFFLGLRHLPLAEATALIFAAPIFITALSVPLLGEHVGWRRWLSVAAGFAGMLIVVRPGVAAFQPAALWVLGAAVNYALVMISARWIDSRDGAWTLMLYMTLFPGLFASFVVFTDWPAPQVADAPLFLAMAVLGTAALTLISQAFRLAPAAVVAPFDYTALIWASLLGWLVWGEVPGLSTYAGAAVIAASGLYIIWREARANPADAPQASRSVR